MTHVPTQTELPTENSDSTRKFIFTVLLLFLHTRAQALTWLITSEVEVVGKGEGAKSTVSIRNFRKQSSEQEGGVCLIYIQHFP
jgi:hypothetical protein